ncbi:NusA-like transcription termination signal-binding factor [Candidatus Micrarchaeota archaeon]|nr:NusA-like transcription termination signal-binding factor [Candidatus Micrarchaeota archaeon]
MRTLSTADFQLLNLLEDKTGVRALDVFQAESALVFVVPSGSAGKVLGKQGSNRLRLERFVGKSVDVVEQSETLEGFARNCFRPAEIRQVDVKEQGKKVIVKVDASQRGLAIGRSGERIKRARLLLKRYFDVDDVKLV